MYEKVNAHLKVIEKEIESIRELYHHPEPEPDTHLVRAGENLQAALDTFNRIELEAGAIFEGSYTIRRPDSILYGNHGRLQGQHGPALIIPIGFRGFTAKDLTTNTNHNNAVILVGENTTKQNTLESVPYDIRFENVRIPGHRGKRGFEINSRGTTLIDCEVLDLYDPGARDSQAVAILNSPGNILIEGGRYEAASENILVGGDRMKIPNTRPTDIGIYNLEVNKPLVWKDQIPNIKNLIELKDGHDVTISNVVGRNCWRSGQDGYAFVFTPVLGASLKNIQVIDCDIENVGSIVQILGVDLDKENTVRSQITFQGGRYSTKKSVMGGRGIFALITGGPEYLDIGDIDSMTDGNQFIYVGDTRPVQRLKAVNSKWNTGQYGITLGGRHQGNNSDGIVTDYIIRDNEITINGMTSTQSRNFKLNVPDNIFV